MAFFSTQNLLAHPAENYVWDTNTMAWVKETQPGGAGGGATTIADGADVAQGTTTDVAWVSGAGTVISLLKKIASAGGSAVSVADGADVAEGAVADVAVQGDNPGTLSAKLRGLNKSVAAGLPVTGTFWQGTQPVSGAISFTAPQHIIADSGTITTVSAVTGITNPIHAIVDSGSLNVGTVTTLPAITFAAPQHTIVDSGTTTVTQATGTNLHVVVDTAPSTAVTNASLDGTTLTTLDTDIKSNITLHAGSNVIGHVINDASTAVIGHVIVDSDASIPALGQALAAGSLPVILPSATISTLTPPSNTGYALDASLTTLNTSLGSIEADIEDPHVTSGTTVAPTQIDIIGGRTADLTPQFQPLPLTSGGAAVQVAVPNDPILQTLLLLVAEHRMMRQAFQDWSGTSPRIDPALLPTITIQ